MKYFLVTLLILFTLGAAAFSARAQTWKTSSPVLLRRQLSELNKNFTYRRKAIHPLGIKDLVSWIGGAEFPGATALAVAGTFDSNRYSGDYETDEDKLVFINLEEESFQKAWFGYKHLGRLANGYHVLRTFESGGGTATFEFLLLVEATIDYEYENSGQRRDLLVLKRRGEFNLGDRYAGEIEIRPKENTIIIGADIPDGRPTDDMVKRTRIVIR